MTKKDLSFLASFPIAHRGLHSAGKPENSLAAFGAAVRRGYAIELDVHLLSDGSVVVFHDDNLKRMCGTDIEVKTLTARKIRKYRLGDTNERIPLLKDVLALVNGAVPLIIELKYDVSVGKLENALVGLLKDYGGEYALKSFSPLIVCNLRRKFRKKPVGQLYSQSMFSGLSGAKKWAFRRIVNMSLWRSDFISVNKDDLEDSHILLQHDLGKIILAWTIDSTSQRLAAMKLADNCICEKIL